MERSAAYTSNVGSAEPNIVELQQEVARLRSELDRCEAATQAVENEKGELRGLLAEMSVQLGRARQAQEWAETDGPSPTERVRLWWGGAESAARRSAGAVGRRLRNDQQTS